MKAHDEDLAIAAALEKRIASIMERHATQVRVTQFKALTHR